MRDALNNTGRPIYYSITQIVPWGPAQGDFRSSMHCHDGAAFTIKQWLQQGLDPSTLANSYLIEYCNNKDFFGWVTFISPPALISLPQLSPIARCTPTSPRSQSVGASRFCLGAGHFKQIAIFHPLTVLNMLRNITYPKHTLTHARAHTI